MPKPMIKIFFDFKGEDELSLKYLGDAWKVYMLGGDDWVDGSAQDDTVYGGDGHDWLAGYGGNDRLYGETGNDTLAGEAGDDYLDGGTGDDTLYCGDGNDVAFGGDDKDWIDGGIGHDTIGGGQGDDVLNGGDGFDVLIGGAGSDKMDGGDGEDTFLDSEGADTIDGGAGWNTVWYDVSKTGVDVNLMTGQGSGGDAQGDVLKHIQTVVGSKYDDKLSGDDYDNELRGLSGKDVLVGQDGNDIVDGGDGDDVVDGGREVDVLTGGAGADVFVFRALETYDGKLADEIKDFESGIDKIDLSHYLNSEKLHLAETAGADGKPYEVTLVDGFYNDAATTRIRIDWEGDGKTFEDVIDVRAPGYLFGLSASDLVL